MTSLNSELWQSKTKLLRILHIIILILSILLIVVMSLVIFKNYPYFTHDRYRKIQFWICCAFLADFFIEFFLAHEKKVYLKHRFIFFLISIPYLSILNWMHVEVPQHIDYFLKFLPLIRGAYALAIIVAWLSYSATSSLFTTYLTIIASMIYISSMIFFEAEQPVNNMVTNYWLALWWALMDATTVGSNINAITTVGKVLAVLLSGMGMLMLPIFTVFITSRIQRNEENRKQKIFHMFGEEDSDSKNIPAYASGNPQNK